MVDVEEFVDIYFTPPKDIEDFVALRSILAGYGAVVRYVYMHPHRNLFRTKLYVSAPRSKRSIVEELIRRFRGRVREREILITECYRGVIASCVGASGYPLGFYGDWLVGINLPCRVIFAGNRGLCLSAMKHLFSLYFLDHGSCCFVSGDGGAVGKVSRELPLIYNPAIINSLAEALARYYNMSQNTAGIARILYRALGVIPGEGEEEEEGVSVGREAEVEEWFLGAVRFGRFDRDVMTCDLSGLGEGHRVIAAVYLANIMYPFVYGVSDNFLDYARHEDVFLNFAFYSSSTDIGRLYSKASPHYIVVMEPGRSSLYVPYRIGREVGFAELGFVPLWRVLK